MKLENMLEFEFVVEFEVEFEVEVIVGRGRRDLVVEVERVVDAEEEEEEEGVEEVVGRISILIGSDEEAGVSMAFNTLCIVLMTGVAVTVGFWLGKSNEATALVCWGVGAMIGPRWDHLFEVSRFCLGGCVCFCIPVLLWFGI